MPRCPECREPGARERLGCDAPASSWVWRATCPACSGGDQECARCEGSGTAAFFRCPASMCDPEVRALADSYAAYKAGFLPAPGGWNDQSRSWVKALRIFEAELRVIEEAREAVRKARASKPTGG